MSEIVARLTIRLAEGKTERRVLLLGQSIEIGRAEGTDIRIQSPKVSRFHAAIRGTKDGIVVQDLGSLNGTFVNGKLIVTNCQLTSGDKVSVGDTDILIDVIASSAESIPVSDDTRPVEMQVKRGTILVSDIRGYTRLSEELPAQELAAVMRVWSEKVTTVVQLLDGTVDKFIGDSALSYWLKPAIAESPSDEQMAEKAFAAAKRIQAETMALESSVLWPFSPKYRWKVKSSLSTGEVVFGNIGRGDARSYTIFGDSVNIAFRLNDLCSELEKDILCDERTANLKVGRYQFLQKANLEGRTEPVMVYLPK